MLIAVAGIKRSGSTVQYNLIRIALQHAGYKVNPCKHNYEPRKVSEGEVDLVKRHPFKRSIAKAADHIFLTDRDDEEILASMERFTGERPGPDKLKKMRINLYLWSKHTTHDYYFHYQNWITEPLYWADKVLQRFKIKNHKRFMNVYAQDILDEFNQIEIPDEYDPVTCLFPNHRTSV